MITLIGENDYGNPPSQSDLQTWANDYGITHPVVADADFNGDGYSFDITAGYLFANPNFNGSFGLPNMQLLSSGMRVETTNDWLQMSDITPFLQ